MIEANSLQLRVITIGLYQFLSRSLLSDPCSLRSTFTRRFWFLVSAIPEPCCFPGLRSPETRLPIASLRYRLSPYGKLRFCLRKAPLLPTEARLPTEAPPLCLRKAPFSFSLCITSCNKLSFSATESSRLHVTAFNIRRK